MNSSINKLTPPGEQVVLPRQRLFQQLDQARKRPVVWIHGPGGAGKSTLASSYLAARGLPAYWYQVDAADRDPANLFYYFNQLSQAHGLNANLPLLTPEYLQGIDSFTRRYFEAFFQQLSPPAVLVLDDLHEADDDTIHQLLNIALQEVPDGISVLVLSRVPPPPVLARLRANRRLAQLDWDHLRLDAEETSGIVNLYRPADPHSEALAKRLNQKTGGWVAGVILLLERGSGSHLAGNPDESNLEEVFNYFASELFDNISPERQQFFLRTSLLPELTPEMAAALTEYQDAPRLLEVLHQRNLFIEKRLLPTPTYRYHPLFQEFLQQRANIDLPTDDLNAVRRKSGQLLEESDRHPQAAELYRAGGHWPELTRMILGQAAALLSQGRSTMLQGWLESLPEALLRSDPWLQFWYGCSLMAGSFAAARDNFRAALASFRSNQDAAGAYLAWASIIDTYAFELDHLTPLDHWLEVFVQLQATFPDYPSPAIELRATASKFVALVLRPVHRQQIEDWSERVEQLLLANDDLAVRMQTGFYRSAYAVWTGDLRKNAEIVGEMRQIIDRHPLPPLLKLTVLMLEAMHGWLTGNHLACMTAVDAGLKLSEQSGVRAWELLFYSCAAEGALIVGDLKTSHAMQRPIEQAISGAGSLMVSFHHIQAAWVALIENDSGKALFHLGEASRRIEWLGSPYHTALWHLGYALAKLQAGTTAESAEHLQEARSVGEQMGSRIVLFLAGLAEAQAAFENADRVGGETALQSALAIGRQENYLFWIWFLPDQVAKLSLRALDAGIETAYVQGLVRERQLQPPTGAEACRDWPWPLQITTLGGFVIRQDGKRLEFTGKVQKKPLELLKALIAHGGREVDELVLYEDIWPDGDPITACKTLKTTLHRLRKLLGDEQAVQFHEGRLSLNRQRIWVDAWAFEALLSRARTAWQTGKSEQATPLIEQALGLYQGIFLPADRDKPWSHSRRERLRERFVTNVGRIGEVFTSTGQTDQAIECYRRSLQIDDRTEALYRQLMSCYRQAGLIDEAIAVYRRCQKILAAVGSEPSAQTRALFQSLR